MTSPAHRRRVRLLSCGGLAAARAASLVVAGCRGGTEGKPGQRAAADTPRRGGTAVIGWTADIKGINELGAPTSNLNDEVLFRVFLHLLEEQPDFEQHPPTMKPQLAKSYD